MALREMLKQNGGADASAGLASASPLRLSPVELRNREAINDPALEGYSVGGRLLPAEFSLDPERRLPKLEDACAFGDFRYVPDREGIGVELVGYQGKKRQIEVPDSINGLPVVSLAAGLFRDCKELSYVTLPEALRRIGNHAFSGCSSLEGIRLPEGVERVPATAFEGCGALGSVQFEAPFVRVEQGAFSNSPVESILLGAKVRSFELVPGGSSSLKRICVKEENPYFATDGISLFSKDGAILVSLVIPLSQYSVPRGCTMIGERAFWSARCLESVTLPLGLQKIGRLAFAKTALKEIELPPSLRYVGEKAFFQCECLELCSFPEGIEEIGAEAFAGTALCRVKLPTSLRLLGSRAFFRTPAQGAVSRGGLTIPDDNPHLCMDTKGGLYAGDTLIELTGDVSSYEVRKDTRRIALRACCRHATLSRVVFPESLREIADEAFRGCRKLTQADFPGSLECVGAFAFAETQLRSVRLPRSLRSLGKSALLVRGEGIERTGRPLQSLEVDAENPAFYKESGLLCQRGGGYAGGDSCLLYVGPDTVVRIPETVNHLAPSAFCGASEIDELHVHANLRSICLDALSTMRTVPRVGVDLRDELGTVVRKSFRVPGFTPQYRCLTDLFTTDERGTVFRFAYYDAWVSHASDLQEFAFAALERLIDPVGLSERAKELYLGIFDRKREQVCRLFSVMGDYAALVALCDFGVLGEGDVAEVLEWAACQGQAQATACLLELKRRCGWQAKMDFWL